MMQWTPARLEQFQGEIERARKRRTQVKDTYDWDGNLERYVPQPKTDSTGAKTWDVNVGADFQDVERKKAALFYDTPAVSFVPDEPGMPLGPPPQPDPNTGQPTGPPPPTLGAVTYLHQKLVNGLLGPRRADAKSVVLKTLFNVLCPAGVGVVKVGYDVATVTVQQPVTDPVTGQPQVDPMTGQPVAQAVPVPIHEDWYLAPISPYAYLVPADHRDTDVRSAAWVGFDFCLPVSEARRRFGLPPEWKPTETAGDERPYYRDDDLEGGADKGEAQVTGVYLEYRPAMLAQEGDPQAHPLQICELVLIDGEKEPVQHRPSPHQTIGNDARLTPDSITDFTVVPLTLRDRTDQAYVPSDCTATAALTKEVNKYRTITVKQRDANRVVMLYDPEKINSEARDQIKKGDVGTWVPVEPGMLEDPSKVMVQVTQLSQGRENWTGQDYIERDRERILGIGGNQVGVQGKTNRTATEVNTVQRNTEARFEQERQRVLDWYIKVVTLFDAMVLRYADIRTAATVLGPQAAQVWAQHKQHLAGAYRYEVQIDSGKYVDVEANKRQLLQLLNMVGQSQHVNVVPILERVAVAFGMDPQQMVVPQPPKKGPEPPKVSLAFKGEDFNAGLPQFDIIIELAKQGGYQISDTAIQAAKDKAAMQSLLAMQTPAQPDTPVPGEPPQITKTLPKTQTLNQHQSDESGGMPGAGPM